MQAAPALRRRGGRGRRLPRRARRGGDGGRRGAREDLARSRHRLRQDAGPQPGAAARTWTASSALGFPVLVGASRKSFIAAIDSATASSADDRLGGSIAAGAGRPRRAGAAMRARPRRAETVQALAVAAAIGDARIHELTARGRVLAIAGSDSGGGAGVQADIKTVTALGGYAASADHRRHRAEHPRRPRRPPGPAGRRSPPRRARCWPTSAPTRSRPACWATPRRSRPSPKRWPTAPRIPLVVDPVMVANERRAAARRGRAATLCARCSSPAPPCSPPTHRRPSALTGLAVATTDDLRRAGEALLTCGRQGGADEGRPRRRANSVIDLLMTPAGETIFEGPRIDTRHTHGTGCTLASRLRRRPRPGPDAGTAPSRAPGPMSPRPSAARRASAPAPDRSTTPGR